jgi:hypothetical protein
MAYMRQVASRKLFRNMFGFETPRGNMFSAAVVASTQGMSRTAAAAAGKDGHILLGGAAVPEAVLRGKGLRALLDAQQQAAGHVPVGGLIDGECVGELAVLILETLLWRTDWAGFLPAAAVSSTQLLTGVAPSQAALSSQSPSNKTMATSIRHACPLHSECTTIKPADPPAC